MRCDRDARAAAKALLAELRRPPPPPPPLPAWRTVSSKKLAEARLLLLLSKGNPSALQRTQRCGKCDDCLTDDCGVCVACLDKRRFGGKGLRKQACLQRSCAHASRVTKRKG